MPIRQKNVHRESMVGVETHKHYIADTGDGSGNAIGQPIVISDAIKVELLELGVAAEACNNTLGARLEQVGDGGYVTAGTIVAQSSTAGDAGAADEWGVTRFSPPVEVGLDYTDASTKLNLGGNKYAVGRAKLSLRKQGNATTFNGWIWCKLRVTRVEDA